MSNHPETRSKRHVEFATARPFEKIERMVYLQRNNLLTRSSFSDNHWSS